MKNRHSYSLLNKDLFKILEMRKRKDRQINDLALEFSIENVIKKIFIQKTGHSKSRGPLKKAILERTIALFLFFFNSLVSHVNYLHDYIF